MWLEKSNNDLKKLNSIREELDEMLLQYCIENNYYEFLKQPDLFNSNYSAGINWNSQKQIIPMFETMGLDLLVKDKKTGNYKKSIESNVLKNYSDKPFIKKFLEYQKAQKLVSTYGLEFMNNINPVTGRIHPNFTQIMNTGRLSSGGGGSINLQNIPRGKERDCFTVDKDNLFIVADYAS
jgi:DNA polymerase I-like protein with 3'-5' exonuclease and polymerase domains